MKIVLRFLTGLVGLVALLAAASYLLPRTVTVARSVEIAAPPDAVFPHIDNLQTFAEWSPWRDLDADMVQTFEGPERGIGNRMTWSSDDPDVGYGSQEIVGLEENARIETALNFGDMGTSKAAFTLTPASGGTEVTWQLDADMGHNPIGRYMGLMMDTWVGADYEKGLANLKARVEGAQV